MTSEKAAYLEALDSYEKELERLLEGIDYCFDWRPEEGEWSAREVIYHMLHSPVGGVHKAVQGMLSGQPETVNLVADETHLTPERQERDLDGVRQDIAELLSGLREAVASASEEDLDNAQADVYLSRTGATEPRTARNMVERIFVGHWKTHLEQIAALRESLGLD